MHGFGALGVRKFTGILILIIGCLLAVPGWAQSKQNDDVYGAIAYSPLGGAYGYASAYRSRAEAEKRAVQECTARTDTGDCHALVWYANACGALATSAKAYGSGWGEDRSAAEYFALGECKKFDSECVVATWSCVANPEETAAELE